jgi:DNA-binding Lrp family transcriptional regulator
MSRLNGNFQVNGKTKMKDIEWKLLSELMKNSRRSDRELAKAVGSSQPTVSRHRKKLEEEGYIREYTMIPDFSRIGYELMALTFLRLGKFYGPEEIRDIRSKIREKLETAPSEIVLFQKGIGLDYHGVIVSFHKEYAGSRKLVDWIRTLNFVELDDMKQFIIRLDDEVQFRPLTFTTLAKHLLNLNQEKKK